MAENQEDSATQAVPQEPQAEQTEQSQLGRTAQFTAGAAGQPERTASVFNAPPGDYHIGNVPELPKAIQANPSFSVGSINELANLPSSDGLSATDASRRLLGGGMLKTANGQSEATHEAASNFQSTSKTY